MSSVQRTVGGGRVYDKKLFCLEEVSQFARHLTKKHMNEPEVVDFTNKVGKERQKCIKKMRLQGNFDYSQKVLTTGDGELKVVRRGKEEKGGGTFLPCKHCLGFYKKDELWRHSQECDLMHGSYELEKENDVVNAGKWLIHGGSAPGYATEELRQHVLTTLRDDDISEVIKKDRLIIQMGNSKN